MPRPGPVAIASSLRLWWTSCASPGMSRPMRRSPSPPPCPTGRGCRRRRRSPWPLRSPCSGWRGSDGRPGGGRAPVSARGAPRARHPLRDCSTSSRRCAASRGTPYGSTSARWRSRPCHSTWVGGGSGWRRRARGVARDVGVQRAAGGVRAGVLTAGRRVPALGAVVRHRASARAARATSFACALRERPGGPGGHSAG